MGNRTEPIDFLTGGAGVELEIGAEITGATEGSVLFAGAGGILQQNNARLFWDDGDRLLGLGTNSPTDSLDIAQVGNSGTIRIRAFSENSVVFVAADGVLSQDTTGLTFRPTNNQLGIGIALPAQNLSILVTNTVQSATMRLQHSGSSGIGSVSFSMIGHSGSSGDVVILQQETGGESWAFGIDNDQGDRWTISNAGSVGLSNRLFIDSSKVQLQLEDAANTVVDLVLRLTHALTGASDPAVAGMGVGMEFEVEVRSNQFRVGAIIEAVTTDVGSGTEDFDLVFRTMAAGAAAAERMSILSTGDVLISTGSLDLNSQGGLLNIGRAGNDWTGPRLDHKSSQAGGGIVLEVENTNSAANSTAHMRVRVDPSSTGDPAFILGLIGGTFWQMGIDNSAGDGFVIAANSGFGGNDAFRIAVATPPVITYNTTHPTGTFDYVCEACGRNEGEMFRCCGKVEWQDDVALAIQAIQGQEGAIDRMAKIGVMERTIDNDGNPEVFTRLGMDVAFAWAMAGQNRQLIDRRYDELDTRLKKLGV